MARAKNVTTNDHYRYQPVKSKKWAKRFGNQVRIGRRDYSLIFCEQITDEEGSSIAGLCDPEHHRILVDVTREAEATLLHEIIHGEIFEAGFHQRPNWDSGVEEQLTEIISQGISHAFAFRKR